MLLPAETIVGAAIGPHAAGRQVASLGGHVARDDPLALTHARLPVDLTAEPPILQHAPLLKDRWAAATACGGLNGDQGLRIVHDGNDGAHVLFIISHCELRIC